MSSEPNTPNRNSFLARVGRYMLDQLNSDRAELAVGGKADEEEEVEETKTVEVDLENETVKAAIDEAVKKAVEEKIGARVAREKKNTEAAEQKLKELQEKYDTAEESIGTLTTERDDAVKGKDEAVGLATVLKIVIEEQVPLDVVQRLKGDTEDELRAAVKAVKGSGNNVNRLFDGKDTSKKTDPASLIAELAKSAAASHSMR